MAVSQRESFRSSLLASAIAWHLAQQASCDLPTQPAVPVSVPTRSSIELNFMFGIPVVSGCLHALSMALRKLGGGVNAWQWWLGIISDGVGGTIFMVGSPFVPSMLLLPTLSVSQACSGYVLGIWCFKERSSKRGLLGLVCAVLGAICLGAQENDKPPTSRIDEFFWRVLRPQFAGVNAAILLLVLISSRVGTDKSMMYCLLAAHADGLQFLATRTLASAALVGDGLLEIGVLAVGGYKFLFLLLYLRFQQAALAENLSRVGAAYPTLSAILPCLLGAPFFGESFNSSPQFLLAIVAIFLGLGLLSGGNEAKQAELEASSQQVELEKTGQYLETASQEVEPEVVGRRHVTSPVLAVE